MTKTRPAKHKDQNVFKFKTFSERLSNVNVDVVHNLQAARGDVPEEKETWFEETLDKWADLCLSEGFTKLVKSLGSKGNTLAELILHKEEIVQLLLEHIELKSEAYLEPLLELVAALARDLKREFQEYFPKIFSAIITNLDTRNPEQLEWSFTSLAYMYKALLKFLIQSIKTTYKLQCFLLNAKQPEHVRVFAAESFALLGRKVLDKKGFIDILFKDVSQNSERSQGVGQLLFEIVRGVKNQLHSCSEVYLNFIFTSLSRTDLDQDNIMSSISFALTGLTSYLDSKGAQPLFTCLYEHLKNSKSTAQYSLALLQILHQLVTYQNGALVNDVVPLVKLVADFLDSELVLSDDAKWCLVDIAATLVTSQKLKLQMEHTSTLIKLVYASTTLPTDAIATFTQQMTSISLFESHVLSHFLSFCHRKVTTDEGSFDRVLEMIAKVVHVKRPLPHTREEGEGWKAYPLEFTFAMKRSSSGKSRNFPELCEKLLTSPKMADIQASLEKYVLVAYVLPHIRPLPTLKAQTCLGNLFTLILAHLDNTFPATVSKVVATKRRKSAPEQEEIVLIPTMDKEAERLCLLLSVVASSLSVIGDSVSVNSQLVESVCLRSDVTRGCVHLLRVLDLFGRKEVEFDERRFKEYFEQLKDNLSSPYHQIRLLTLQILAGFKPPLPTPPENSHYESVFKVCLDAERLPLTVQTQREKVKYLQKLDAEYVHYSLPLGGSADSVPVLYLMSQLFANYKPMWDPVMKLMVTYSNLEYFWGVFMKHLFLVTEITKRESMQQQAVLEDGVAADVTSDWTELEERVDYKNARSLLWRAMTFFADVAEKKNRELVPMFFRFLETEYYREDASVARVQNISKRNEEQPSKKQKVDIEERTEIALKAEEEPMEVDVIPDGKDSESENSGEESEKEEEPETPKPKVKNARQKKNATTDRKMSRKGAVKLLCAHLAVFAKFNQPRNMHQEENFRKILDTFLAHRNENVQKLALDCLVAYNYKYIVTYKKHLYGLLDDKNFRHAIVLFNIDNQSDVIQPEHREELMPIVMRILYGRMHGKAKAARQGVVLRFLGGSSDAEVKTFLELAFNLFLPYVEGDLSTQIVKIIDSGDLTQVLPLKRIQAALNLIGLIFHKLGNLIQGTLPWLLKLLLVIGAHVLSLLKKRSEVDPAHIDLLKQLRNIVIQRVMDFFLKFEKYSWTCEEIDAIYTVVVTPQLSLLSSESFATPTPLLKLIACWSQNPRYFPLLAKKEATGSYPVNELVSILTGGKVSGGVANTIMDGFERLVTFENFAGKIDDDDVGITELPVGDMVDVSTVDVFKFAEPPNFGSRLLSLHSRRILSYLEGEVARSSKGFKKGLSTRDLTVLMRLSEFVSDSDQSRKLVDIIIPAVSAGHDVRSADSWGEGKKGGKRLTEEQTDFLLSTLAFLMKNVRDSKQYYRILAPLLGKINSRSSRTSLCNVFLAIGGSEDSLANQIAGLNAYDTRRMEEPDFNRRLDAYKIINSQLNDGTASLDMALMVIHNCSQSLRMDDDMSLRDSSSFCLQNLATYLLKIDESGAKSLMGNHLIPQVRQLIRSKKEQVRHEAVTILAVLVKKCPNLHPQLRDLAKLEDTDAEVDFFENMRHMQGHRRARALVKVAAKLKETHKLLQPDTLTQYIMPLASVYLFSDVYLKQSHLVDAAIETMNAICKNLPWFSYDKILRYYLQQLVKRAEFQKQAVRVVVAILDGFHFNLANSKAAIRNAEQPPAEEVVAQKPGEANAQPPEANSELVEGAEPSEEVLDLESVMEGQADLEETVKEQTQAEALSHTVTPAESTASKIHDTIMRSILPQLHRLLTARSKRDGQHKVNRGQDYYPEDEEILRVPLALAMVALLKGLPKGTLERNLPGIFMKIFTFLKSRANSIRETARDTLVKIMTFLGPTFLYSLIREGNAILKRGFQVHVLIYTLHAVLHHILPQVKVGDFDGIISQVVQLCIQEMFGETAEEKEVAQIVSKVKEAKGHKSYDLLNMMSKYVTQKRLMPLVTPFKDVLTTTKSHKIIRKVEDCYFHIATGLASNESITLQSELIFIHGIVTESIPQWFPKQVLVKEDSKPVFEKQDSYLIVAEPKRKSAAATGKESAKLGIKTHSHIITEFALQLLHLRLKKENILPEDNVVLGMLDPFIPILADSLASPHNKQIALALRSLTKLLALPLPSIEKNIKRICGSVFTILSKYSGVTSVQSEQYEMVVSAYKLVTVIVRDVSTFTLENDQLRVLLTYAETSLADVDGNSQATGFAVLKSILGRKLEFPELPDVMERIAKLAVTSEISHVRSQCRQLFLQYLIDYPHGKKVIRQIRFFLGQLEYDREDGRLSALEFLDSVFGTFPRSLLNGNAPLLFVTLSPRLVNEHSATCVRMVAVVLKKLINALDDPVKDELFQIVLLWLQDENVLHRIIAVQLAAIFMEVEGTKFEPRLKELLPLFEIALSEDTAGDLLRDRLLIQLLLTTTKLFTSSPVFVRSDATAKIWREIQKHLLHEQLAVRILCARLIGVLFAAFTPEEIADYLNSKKRAKNMMAFENPTERLRTLALDCSDQLSPLDVEKELTEQIIKNLLFLFKVTARAGPSDENEVQSDDEEENPTQKKKLFGVRWFIKRVRKEINSEIAENPNSGVKRTAAFQFYAAALLDLHQTSGPQAVIQHIGTVLPPIVREISISEDKPVAELAELATLAREIAELLKQLVGHEAYSEVLATCRKTMNKKKVLRKAEKSQMAVTNPGLAAKLKIKKQANKKDAKKKKIALLKGKVMKKKRLKDVAVVED